MPVSYTHLYSINYSSFELTDINQWDKAIVKKNAILRYFLQRFGILTATVCRAYPNIMLDDNDLDFLESRSIAAFTEARKILKRWF